jgi:hypothetical protein
MILLSAKEIMNLLMPIAQFGKKTHNILDVKPNEPVV